MNRSRIICGSGPHAVSVVAISTAGTHASPYRLLCGGSAGLGILAVTRPEATSQP